MSHGSEVRQRSWHLTVRLSMAERVFIDANAERAGLTPGSYVRQVVLGASAPRQVRRPPVEAQMLSRVLGELGKIGSNVNQIAKFANSGVLVYGGEMDAAADAILEMRDAVMKALGRTP